MVRCLIFTSKSFLIRQWLISQGEDPGDKERKHYTSEATTSGLRTRDFWSTVNALTTWPLVTPALHELASDNHAHYPLAIDLFPCNRRFQYTG